MGHVPCPFRRGSILLAVMVVLGIGALIGTSLLLRVQGERATAGVAMRRAQSRALAWSGVQAAMAELAAGREVLLDGGEVPLTETWELFREGSTRGVVRLLPVGPGGERWVPESTRLDANLATAEMLARVPGLDAPVAAKIVAGRGSGYSSVEAVGAFAKGDAWRECLTTLSFDPNLQCGVAGNEQGKGLLRVSLADGWNDALAQAIKERFGDDAARNAEQTLKSRPAITKDGDLVALLGGMGVEAKFWAVFLDFFTTCNDEFRLGRVDVNRADASVLACIPGIDEAAARKIVAAREALSPQSRMDVAWPAVEGIVSREDFQKAADWLTVRSMQWRIRVEAGISTEAEGHGGIGGLSGASGLGPAASAAVPDEGEWRDAADAPLRYPVILEAVIDVSGRRPRVAYLRDVTYLSAAKELSERREPREEEEPAPSGDESAMRPDPAESGERTAAPRPQPPRSRVGTESRVRTPDATPAPEQAPPPATEAAPASRTPSPFQDRRIGRWTTGGKT